MITTIIRSTDQQMLNALYNYLHEECGITNVFLEHDRISVLGTNNKINHLTQGFEAGWKAKENQNADCGVRTSAADGQRHGSQTPDFGATGHAPED